MSDHDKHEPISFEELAKKVVPTEEQVIQSHDACHTSSGMCLMSMLYLIDTEFSTEDVKDIMLLTIQGLIKALAEKVESDLERLN